jgi:hypothetical protein
MTCDKFLTLTQRNPKECSSFDVGFSQRHYLVCRQCHVLFDEGAFVPGLNEHSRAWRIAWAELDADAKKGWTVILAVTFCLFLGAFLRWWL